MKFESNIRHTPALACILILQFTVLLVHGLPTTANVVEDVTSREKASSADRFLLDSRQDIPDPLAIFPRGPLNQLLRMFSSLPAGERALDATAKLLTPLQQGLARAAGIGTSRDDMAQQDAPCSDITVIFARGTTEPGNVGLVTGPPFFEALSEQLGGKSLSLQGVEYPASFAGFNQNGTEGVPSM